MTSLNEGYRCCGDVFPGGGPCGSLVGFAFEVD